MRHAVKAYAASSKTDTGVQAVFLDAIRYSYAVYMEEKEHRLQEEMQRAELSEKKARWILKHVNAGKSLAELYAHMLTKRGTAQKLFTVLSYVSSSRKLAHGRYGSIGYASL